MKQLEERIRKEGVVRNGNVLRVDSFLNHQMDIDLFNAMGQEFSRRFSDRPVNKILTIEASGIGLACITAQYFHVQMCIRDRYWDMHLAVFRRLISSGA